MPIDSSKEEAVAEIGGCGNPLPGIHLCVTKKQKQQNTKSDQGFKFKDPSSNGLPIKPTYIHTMDLGGTGDIVSTSRGRA